MQLARVTERVWLTIFIHYDEQILCQLGDRLGTYHAEPVPINPGSLVCEWSGWEACNQEEGFSHGMNGGGRSRLEGW